jgi:serine/threonine protein kinase
VTTVDSPLADALRDRYLLERELGRGGMATVYLARDLRHDRPVALKVLHQELAHALGPERFVREIKVAAGLQHPHILPVSASAQALGRRTGAGLVVFGTMVPKGRDSVTLRAGVLDAVSGLGQREVEVSGESARIGELADSLGIRILQALGRSRAIGSGRQVSMGSRSLPALKSFLQGEQFYRRGL